MPINLKPLPALSLQDIARFWSLVDRSGGPYACWPYMGYRNDKGHGVFTKWLGPDIYGQKIMAHRIAYLDHYGVDAYPLLVLHRCPGGTDRPYCCNPSHLHAGSHSDNMKDLFKRLGPGARYWYVQGKIAQQRLRSLSR